MTNSGDFVRSLITLGIGQMEIDWGKYTTVNNHSALFQHCDLKSIPYYCVNYDTDKPLVKIGKGFSRKLKHVKPRLDLLGYDLTSIQTRFDELVQDHENHGGTVPLTFDTFYDAIIEMDLSTASTVKYEIEGYDNDYDLGEYADKCVLQIPELNQRLVGEPPEGRFGWVDVMGDLSVFLENMDPYITLRILAENPANLDLEVQWNYSEAIAEGWINEDEIFCDLPPINRILIVTEGSSDSFILKKAIEEMYPEIADFFDFVDMNENYPFTGTGNLYNFCMGLCRINVLNKIMVIFDNDTAGLEKYKQVGMLKKPQSFFVAKLPDHSDFCNMQTVGPQGETIENVNGKAVAIECFLDFGSVSYPPSIRWTGYNKKEKAYQGELENKDDYVRAFKGVSLVDSTYNTSKLKYLIEYLIRQWINRLH